VALLKAITINKVALLWGALLKVSIISKVAPLKVALLKGSTRISNSSKV
jgi:hypothetical protein